MLGEFIYKRFGVNIPAAAWREENLPDHLKMRFSIIDQGGKEIRSGRDKGVLVNGSSSGSRSAELGSAVKKWEKEGLTQWNFGDLPESVNLKIKGNTNWMVYPGLEVDKKSGKTLNLRCFNNKERAVESHKKGVNRLFSIHFSRNLKFLKKNLALPGNISSSMIHFGGSELIKRRLYECVINELFSKNIRLETEFFAHAEKVAPLIVQRGRELLDMVIRVVEAFDKTITAIDGFAKRAGNNSSILIFMDHLKEDLARLVPENFMALYTPDRIGHVERYLKASEIRAQRAFVNYEKDRAKSKELEKYTGSLEKLLGEINNSTTREKRKAVEEYFWMIEEYKVSVFAQELKTAIPISKKRLDRKLEEVRRMA